MRKLTCSGQVCNSGPLGPQASSLTDELCPIPLAKLFKNLIVLNLYDSHPQPQTLTHGYLRLYEDLNTGHQI